MTLRIFMIWALLMSAAWTVHADRIIMGTLSSPFYDVYRPKTREEIYTSYRALVEKRDGITKMEALLIAQYEAVQKDLDHGYDTAKPRVIEETSKAFTVRFPSKFSINDRQRPADHIFIIDKENGRIIFSGEKTEH